MKKSSRLISILLAVLTCTLLFSLSASAAQQAAGTLLKASNAKTGIQLNWNETENATVYKIYRREATEKKKTLIAKVEEPEYLDETAVAGKRYGYRVVPVVTGSKGVKSNDLYINRLGTPEITKTANSFAGIKVTWSESEGAEAYRLYRRTEGQKGWKCIAKTDGKTFTFTDKNVTEKDNYTYAVRGYKSGDLSKASKYVKADFIKAPEITKVSSNKTNITVYWAKTDKAASYQVFRKGPSDKAFVKLTTVEATQLKYSDTDVTAGKLYRYTIRAVDENKKVSGCETATACLFMEIPKFTSFSNSSDGVKLTWTKSAGVDGYNIYRRNADATKWKKVAYAKGASTLTATDKSAKNGKDYVYVVRAVWNGTQSAYLSEGVTVRFLTAPKDLKVQSKGESGNYLTWTANKSADRYQVLRKTDGTSWKSLGFTKKNTALDKTAKEGTIYTYTVRAYYGSTYCSAASKTASSSRIDPKGKMVALTYDDGPSNSVTNDILDLLEKYGGKATFFVIGNRIPSSYQPMQRAVKMGCEIGNHTYSHIDLPSYYYDDIRYEIDTTQSLVKKYTGVTPKIVRAPGGSTDSYSRQAVNMPFIYWSIDTRDWESRDADSVISIVKSNVEDGDIILMHDIYDSTAEASETIIPWLINQGYQLVTVSELMQYRGITMQNAVSYSSAY